MDPERDTKTKEEQHTAMHCSRKEKQALQGLQGKSVNRFVFILSYFFTFARRKFMIKPQVRSSVETIKGFFNANDVLSVCYYDLGSLIKCFSHKKKYFR